MQNLLMQYQIGGFLIQISLKKQIVGCFL